MFSIEVLKEPTPTIFSPTHFGIPGVLNFKGAVDDIEELKTLPKSKLEVGDVYVIGGVDTYVYDGEEFYDCKYFNKVT